MRSWKLPARAPQLLHLACVARGADGVGLVCRPDERVDVDRRAGLDERKSERGLVLWSSAADGDTSGTAASAASSTAGGAPDRSLTLLSVHLHCLRVDGTAFAANAERFAVAAIVDTGLAAPAIEAGDFNDVEVV